MTDKQATIRAIDSFITEEMEAGEAPGLAITVVRDGEVVLQRGYGYADIESRAPMTERTGVVIGSTTKALTCAALLQLVEKGQLDLDDPIRRYIPTFRVADEEASAGMTVRQAVTHNAGLPPSLSDDPSFLFTDYAGADACERYVDGVLPTRKLLWAPGGGWVYSNDGFVVAGRVIEVVSGMSYEDYMQRHVFAPLGLEDARFTPEEKHDLPLATPHDYDQDGHAYTSFFPRNRASAAAGSQLILSARDAARWLQAVLDGGRGEQGQVLSAASVAEMVRPMVKVPQGERGSDGSDTSYALGWMAGALDGITTVSHGGATITMGSQFIMVPQERLAVAVVANSVSDLTSIVAEGVTRLMLGREPVRHFPRVDRSFEPDRALWPQLAGTYTPLRLQNTVTGPLPIEFDGQRLRARTYPGDERRRPGDIWLYPV
ncbi:MAG: putative penicillin-binding protein, partial [Chloroflexi bacterium]|nr:putative penicillin-binding protein [Chloroflexota bacterium]